MPALGATHAPRAVAFCEFSERAWPAARLPLEGGRSYPVLRPSGPALVFWGRSGSRGPRNAFH